MSSNIISTRIPISFQYYSFLAFLLLFLDALDAFLLFLYDGFEFLQFCLMD